AAHRTRAESVARTRTYVEAMNATFDVAGNVAPCGKKRCGSAARPLQARNAKNRTLRIFSLTAVLCIAVSFLTCRNLKRHRKVHVPQQARCGNARILREGAFRPMYKYSKFPKF